MKKFKPNLIQAALITNGLAFGVMPAHAQQADTADKQDEVEVIKVSGIRGALQRAQALKMDSKAIVEVLSAEDIGKLPDTSVAESLSRLPGLAGERRNGRTSGLSVRGFNENYVGTTLNGRELLGMGDNRGVEYDLYPSEIVQNIVVYKSSEAGLISQGLGGTVDLQTVNPLNAKSTLVFNGNYERNSEDSANPDFDNTGHKFALNFVEKFADDTIGVALTLASMETPRQEQHFRGWGYADADPSKAAAGVNVAEGTKILGGHDSYARSALLERDSIAAVIQYQPNDKLNIKFDALYIDFQEDDVKRGIEEGGAAWGTGDYTITEVQDGLVTAGYYDGYLSVIRNDARTQESELKTYGLNVEYQINDEWTATADFSTGKVDKTITDVESYSGVGRAGFDGRPSQPRSWVMTSEGATYGAHPSLGQIDYTDPNLIKLAGPQPWGSSLDPVAAFQGVDGFAPNTAQDGFVNQPKFDEELDSIRLQLNGVVEWGIFSEFETGIMYSDRSKTKVNGGAYLTAPTWPDHGPVPSEYVVGTTDLSFMGLGNILAYDSISLYNSGYYTETDAALIENGRLGDSYTVDEELLTAYAKLDIDTEVGDIYIKGNLGLQVVNADQSSSGYATTSGANRYTEAVPVNGGADYTDVLPSLNLSAEVLENQFIRLGLSKVQSRPRLDDMKASSVVDFNPNPQGASPFSSGGGNPALKPLEANQFDLSYENYFADNGYFAVSFFYKDLTNWHRDTQFIVDFSDSYIPGFHQVLVPGTEGEFVDPTTFLGLVSLKEDGLKGFVRGWELQSSLPLDLVHKSLEGFGLVGSMTFLDGHVGNEEDGTRTRVPGLSDESYQLTAYYEKNGFEVRISGTKRSDFFTETRGLSLKLDPIDDLGGKQVDAQISYDFSESGIEALDGLRITLQGQNLTDEPTIQANGDDPRQITQFQSYGRNFLLGVNYSFY